MNSYEKVDAFVYDNVHYLVDNTLLGAQYGIFYSYGEIYQTIENVFSFVHLVPYGLSPFTVILGKSDPEHSNLNRYLNEAA